VCDHISFENVQRWLNDIDKYTPDETPVKVLCGTKADLDHKRTISSADGSNLATQEKLSFFQTSAKTGQGVEEMFMAVARKAKDRHEHKLRTAEEEDLATKVQKRDQAVLMARKSQASKSCCSVV